MWRAILVTPRTRQWRRSEAAVTLRQLGWNRARWVIKGLIEKSKIKILQGSTFSAQVIYLQCSLPCMFYNQSYTRILGQIPVQWHTASTQSTVWLCWSEDLPLLPNLNSTNMTLYFTELLKNSIICLPGKYREVFKTTSSVDENSGTPRHHPSAQITKSASLWMAGSFGFPASDWPPCSKRLVFCLEIFQHGNGQWVTRVGRDLRQSPGHPPVQSRVSCGACPGY